MIHRHICNIEPSCIIIRRVTWSPHMKSISASWSANMNSVYLSTSSDKFIKFGHFIWKFDQVQPSVHVIWFVWGVHQPKYVCLPSLVYMSSYGGSIGQSSFVFQVWCSVIQWHLFSIQWGASTKVGSSANFDVLLFKASILNSWGGTLAKVGSSAHFGVLVFKASLVYFPRGSIGQSRFICQFWCTGIQGIYSQFPGGSIGQSRFVCPFWCTGIQGISGLFPWGVHWPKMTSSVGTRCTLTSCTGSRLLLFSMCNYYTKQQQWHEIISTVNCCCLCVILTLNNNNKMKS